MINSANQYATLTFAAGLAVNGGVMPLRAPAQRNILRAEDKAIAYEHARLAVLLGEGRGDTSKARIYRQLYGDEWRWTCNVFKYGCLPQAQSLYHFRFMQDISLDAQCGTDLNSARDVTSKFWAPGSQSSNEANFRTGQPFVAGNVMAVLNDVNKFRCLAASAIGKPWNPGYYAWGKDLNYSESSTGKPSDKDFGAWFKPSAPQLYSYQGKRSVDSEATEAAGETRYKYASKTYEMDGQSGDFFAAGVLECGYDKHTIAQVVKPGSACYCMARMDEIWTEWSSDTTSNSYDDTFYVLAKCTAGKDGGLQVDIGQLKQGMMARVNKSKPKFTPKHVKGAITSYAVVSYPEWWCMEMSDDTYIR